jgi:hemerythrin-like domain-containing protein
VKRDPRLHGLTSEHHAGLVLARRVRRACEEGRGDAAAVRRRFDAELEPHFRVEEDLLLPALAEAGEHLLARRTLEDHAALRAHLAAAEAGDPARLGAFAALLEVHIRFEERELFPAAERALRAEQLERVQALAPHPRPGR